MGRTLIADGGKIPWQVKVHAGPKPAFGDMARQMGEAWEDSSGPDTREMRMQRLREAMAARDAATPETPAGRNRTTGSDVP
jgi:hypothetical protein